MAWQKQDATGRLMKIDDTFAYVRRVYGRALHRAKELYRGDRFRFIGALSLVENIPSNSYIAT